jgi:hypothetical protein
MLQDLFFRRETKLISLKVKVQHFQTQKKSSSQKTLGTTFLSLLKKTKQLLLICDRILLLW